MGGTPRLWCVGHIMIFTMSHSPYLSIIFVNYQSAWALSLALQSLFSLELEWHLFEVIIINNDKREQRVLEHLATLFPLRIFQNNQNSGFGQGANSALLFAQGEVLGFLNPDIRWREANIGKIVEFFRKQPTPTILGLPLLTSEGEHDPLSYGEAPNLLTLLQNNLLPLGLPRKNTLRRPLDWVSGGALFVPKASFSFLGGFDKNFFLYFEDVDLCLRAKKLGINITLSSFGGITHAGGKSFSSRALQKRHFYMSQNRYYKIHRPVLEWHILRFFHRFFSFV